MQSDVQRFDVYLPNCADWGRDEISYADKLPAKECGFRCHFLRRLQAKNPIFVIHAGASCIFRGRVLDCLFRTQIQNLEQEAFTR